MIEPAQALLGIINNWKLQVTTQSPLSWSFQSLFSSLFKSQKIQNTLLTCLLPAFANQVLRKLTKGHPFASRFSSQLSLPCTVPLLSFNDHLQLLDMQSRFKVPFVDLSENVCSEA